ncbi:MAG: hypothetical protein ACI8P0_003627, partial [Planctomycetaceae bacterium]
VAASPQMIAAVLSSLSISDLSPVSKRGGLVSFC